MGYYTHTSCLLPKAALVTRALTPVTSRTSWAYLFVGLLPALPTGTLQCLHQALPMEVHPEGTTRHLPRTSSISRLLKRPPLASYSRRRAGRCSRGACLDFPDEHMKSQACTGRQATTSGQIPLPTCQGP